MKEHPILFSGPMVRAILDGRKTQTRRVINPQPPSVDQITKMSGSDYSWFRRNNESSFVVAGPVWAVRDAMFLTGTNVNPTLRCPYGVSGDRLWVRETFLCMRPNQERQSSGDADVVLYRASGDSAKPWEDAPKRWSPSIFMPRWASRIDLEVTEVRAQRLQDISPQDAVDEGCFHAGEYATDGVHPYPVATFAKLWDSINGKRAPWASNPWVWAITFQRVRP